MSFSERQRRLLGAMGLRLWDASPGRAAGPPEGAAPAAAAARPAAPPMPTASPVAVSAPVPEPVREREREPSASAEPRPVPAVATADSARRAAAIATLAWSPLEQAVAACTSCSLCATRRQTVFGVGHPHAEWMIVGEAPGEQEDLAGEPFVGPAGQLLDQMLRALGLARTADAPPVPALGPGLAARTGSRPRDEHGDPARRVFIANTLKCRPPRNRNPDPEELAACEPFLRRQVELVQPRVILLMGRFAVKTLLKSDEAIGRLRGRLHRYEGIPVVVTYHPAYLLRNLPDKAKAWADLCLAAQTIDELDAAA